MSSTNIPKLINYIETLIHKISELILIHIVPNMNAIPPAELDFSTISTKGQPLLRFRNKLFVCKKKTRNAGGLVIKCYWYCSSEACTGALNYSIDVNNVLTNDNGTGECIHGIVVTKDHVIDWCKVTENDIVRRVARTDVISQAGLGKILRRQYFALTKI